MNDSVVGLRNLIHGKITQLENSKSGYLDYMQMKIREEDWHGVADCSADLRDIDSAIHHLRLIQNG